MNKLITGLLIFMCVTLAAQTNRSYPPPKVADNLVWQRISLTDFGLTGRVKKYSGEDWIFTGYQPASYEWTFNEKGQLISQAPSYTTGGKTSYKYDAEGKLIECVDGNYVQRFAYDNSGYIILITEIYDGQNIGRTDFNYQDTTYVKSRVNDYGWQTTQFDCQGRPVSKKSGSSAEASIMSIFYRYIPSEGLTMIESDGNNGPYFKTVEKRNSNGLLLETTSYESKGVIYKHQLFDYDAEGRCISKIIKGHKTDPVYTITNQYFTDTTGNIIKMIIDNGEGQNELTWEIEYY